MTAIVLPHDLVRHSDRHGVLQTFLNFDAVLRYLPREKFVEKSIKREYGLDFKSILDIIQAGDQSQLASRGVTDFLLDLLHNHSNLYRRFTARGDHGKYFIDIRGLGGVYYFCANDFGSSGYFLSVDDAADAVTHRWLDSLTSLSGRSYRDDFCCDADKHAATISESKISSTLPKTFLPKARIFDFYVDSASGEIFRQVKWSRPEKSTLVAILKEAISCHEGELQAAVATARSENWQDVVELLRAVADLRYRITQLNTELRNTQGNRRMEIEANDWLRTKGISNPSDADFVQMSNELRPFLRYRELWEEWSRNKPGEYQRAYLRVARIRHKIEQERSQPEDE